jgi:DNA-binding MarR family transcriptional regulator
LHTEPTAFQLPSFHSSEEIQASPRFIEARTSWIHGVLGLYDNDPFINRLLMEAGRSLAFLNILCLYACYEEHDRATWPTIQLLQKTLEQFGVSSARRIHDLVARFAETGYIRPDPAPSDRRARILTPTAKMIALDLDWLAVFYKPLDIMFSDPGYAPALRRDLAFQKSQRRAARQFTGYAAQLMRDNPAWMHFMGREAGSTVLIKLMELDQTEGGEGLAQYSFADLANRFGISRTHVRAMLREAEAADLVELSTTQARVTALAPTLIAAFDRFFADITAGNDLIFQVVMADEARRKNETAPNAAASRREPPD